MSFSALQLVFFYRASVLGLFFFNSSNTSCFYGGGLYFVLVHCTWQPFFIVQLCRRKAVYDELSAPSCILGLLQGVGV
jgi:hypothetical protein